MNLNCNRRKLKALLAHVRHLHGAGDDAVPTARTAVPARPPRPRPGPPSRAPSPRPPSPCLARVVSGQQARDRRQGLQACLDSESRSSSNGKHLVKHPEGHLKIPSVCNRWSCMSRKTRYCIGAATDPPRGKRPRAQNTRLCFGEEPRLARGIEVRRAHSHVYVASRSLLVCLLSS